MAQDFKAIFGVGGDDKSIAFVDANGVTMAATQGLYQFIQNKDAEIAELRRQLGALEDRLNQLEK
jgi:trimeric autotransporter adhesin